MERSSSSAAPLTRERQIFEEYSVPRAVAAMAIPAIISQIITVVYNLADTWFVGLTNDAAAVAAISLCLPVFRLLTAFSNLFGIGGASVISRALGRREYDRAKKVFSISFWCSLLSVSAYSLVIFLVCRPFLLLIGADGSNIDYSVTYTMLTVVIGGIPTTLSASFSHLIRSTGKSKISSYGMTLGAVLNILLDPLFMFVLLPRGYEVAGAALATAVSNLISMLYFALYLSRHRHEPVFYLAPSALKRSGEQVADIAKCGLPSFALCACSMTSNCFLNGILSSMGSSAAMAGLGIVRKIDSFALAVNQGITHGMLPIVGYCYSSGRHKRLKSVVFFSAGCTMSFSLVCAVISYLFAPQLVSVFISDAATIAYGAAFLRVCCISVAIYPFTFVCITIFQAVGHSVKPFILSITRKGSIDIVLFFLFRALYGPQSVIWVAPIMDTVAVALAACMLAHLFHTMTRQKKSPAA